MGIPVPTLFLAPEAELALELLLQTNYPAEKHKRRFSTTPFRSIEPNLMRQSRQKRDNHYYLERLRDECPAIYADYQAGKFKNAAAAFVAAGLRKTKSDLDDLRSAWKKASQSDRSTFKVEIGCIGSVSATSGPVVKNSSGARASASIGLAAATNPVHTHGYLAKDTVAQIEAVIARRRIKVSEMMAEMGFKKLNPALGLALNRGSQIRDPAVLAALENWLTRNSA
jgi:hypothetical protein